MPSSTAPAPGPWDGEIFTSLRYDEQCAEAEPENGPFYMLNYHRDRLVEAATHFSFQGALDRYEGDEGLQWLKENLSKAVADWKRNNRDSSGQDGPLAVRLL
jgi:4-amino-4-deoxychorismate lyase